MADTTRLTRTVYLTVLVAALGYFVDIYDLLLFSIVRVASLKDIGIPDDQLQTTGVFLINVQMFGLLVGGLLWGVLGDVKGRLSVLFGSIFIYSLANFANSFAHTLFDYATWRFVAGIGLAGELGAGITLVAEILPRDKRGLGTTIVASIGILGAVVGGLVGDLTPWRVAYAIGGGLGLCLLLLRIGIAESHLFDQVKRSTAKRGQVWTLFTSRANFLKYLRCILIGVPIWYAIGVLITFSPEFGKALHVTETVKAGYAVMWSYLGLALGDLASGLLSQFFKSRKLAVRLFLVLTLLVCALFLTLNGPSLAFFYFVCSLIGFATGYWAVFVTIGAEQFGTNLRSTVATTVPNFVRGSVIPVTLLFQGLSERVGLVESAAAVGLLCLALAWFSAGSMEETFHKDLNYLE